MTYKYKDKGSIPSAPQLVTTAAATGGDFRWGSGGGGREDSRVTKRAATEVPKSGKLHKGPPWWATGAPGSTPS